VIKHRVGSGLAQMMGTRQGDPTDQSIKLRPLEPASGQALARDLVLKTRRRKGLGDQIAVSKYLDDEFVVSFWIDSKVNHEIKSFFSLLCQRLGMPTYSGRRGKVLLWHLHTWHICK